MFNFFDVGIHLQGRARRERRVPLLLIRHAGLHRDHRFPAFLLFRQIQRLQLDVAGNAEVVLSFADLADFAARRMRCAFDQKDPRKVRLRIRNQDIFFYGDHCFGFFGNIGNLYGGVDGFLTDRCNDALLHLLGRHHRILGYLFFVGHSFSPFQIWSCYNLCPGTCAYTSRSQNSVQTAKKEDLLASFDDLISLHHDELLESCQMRVCFFSGLIGVAAHNRFFDFLMLQRLVLAIP